MIRDRNTTRGAVVAGLAAVLMVWATLPFASVQEPFRNALCLAAAAVSAIALLLGCRISGSGFTSLIWVGFLAAVSSVALSGTDLAWEVASSTPGLSFRLAWYWMSLGVFGMVLAGISHGERARWILCGGAVSAAVVQIAYSLAARLGGKTDEIWRVTVVEAGGRLRGTYVNADHLAFLLLLVLPLSAGYGLWLMRHGIRTMSNRALLVAALCGTFWLAIFSAILSSGSRTAFALAVAVSLLQFAKPVGQLPAKARWLIVGSLVIAIVVPLMAASSRVGSVLSRLSERDERVLAVEKRATVYQETVRSWADSPWFGSGLGSFRERLESKGDLPIGDWWHAHSDPLELLHDVGLVGSAPLFVAWALLLRGLVRRRNHLRSSADRSFATAVALALVAGAVHSTLDFPLANPANALIYVVLCAVAVGLAGGKSAVSSAGRREDSGRTDRSLAR